MLLLHDIRNWVALGPLHQKPQLAPVVSHGVPKLSVYILEVMQHQGSQAPPR